MRKKSLLILTVLITLFALIPSAGATDNQSSGEVSTTPPSTRYTYINTAYTSLNINSGTASIYNQLSCDSCVDKIIISSYLQRYDSGWKTVTSWRETTYNYYASMSHTHSVTSGYTYRVLTYFYAYDGSNMESTSLSDSEYY